MIIFIFSDCSSQGLSSIDLHIYTVSQKAHVFIMVALWDIFCFVVSLLSFYLFFFPRLISAITDMYAILPHMMWP